MMGALKARRRGSHILGAFRCSKARHASWRSRSFNKEIVETGTFFSMEHGNLEKSASNRFGS